MRSLAPLLASLALFCALGCAPEVEPRALSLLSANVGLKAAFGLYDIPARLVLVVILYLFIVAALYYGTLPFRMRDTIGWLYERMVRARLAGVALMLMGLTLLLAATRF